MVQGSFKSKDGLVINFDPTAKLEVQIRKNVWCETSADIFRSWGGDRRINGKPFISRTWYLHTNKIVTEVEQLQTV
jgi:hypothetical protein